MLHRVIHSNGVVTYQSPLLSSAGVPHAFSTRIGGVSSGAFASLNLGNPSDGDQDPATAIQENYRRLHTAIGCPPDMPRAWVKQVHGGMVELIDLEGENEYGETIDAEIRDRFSGQISTDGLVCIVPGVLLTIRVADCVPILLCSQDGRAVAAVHAGWQGIVGQVLAKAIRTLHEAAGAAGHFSKLAAAIGPAISQEHFEVGEEVAAEFSRMNLADAIQPPAPDRPKPHVDLQKAALLQLQRLGIPRIDGNDLCTFRDAGEFYSHRRESGNTGRQVAVITTRP
jgi:polyphenol oxidase